MQWEVNLRDIRVKEVLGNDGDSAVNKAKWDNKTIAVKKYQYDIISENNLYYVCLKFKKINHENILKLYGYTKRIADHYYLLMEYADCGSLHDQIHGTGEENYTRDTALNWMHQCAKGLAFLHEQDITHCNIKPQNLLFTNNFRQLKIGELGFDRDLVKKSKSPEYLPSEELPVRFNETTYDVFSFGMVLWEVLTRRKPFLEMRHDFTPFLEDLPSDNIRSLIESCWSLNKSERPRMGRVAPTIALEMADIQLGEVLGNDGDFAVAKAEWDNKTIAVKKYQYDFQAEKYLDFLCFKLNTINHENVLKYYDYTIRIDNHYYLLMEYADCGSLHDQIHGTGVEKYTIETALNWMHQCAKGLAFLHGQDIVRCNIKPRNLLLTNNFRQLKIGELGINSSLEKSPEYLPPEESPHHIYGSPYEDVFSFGMVLWEVLTRRKPFLEMSDDFTPFLEDLPSDKIRSLIESCWSLNPRERPRMGRVAPTIALEMADIQLGETLGSGSFGVVYKSQLLDVPCAVKEYRAENDDAKEGIEREVKYLSRVTHKNIIDLFGTKDTKDSKTLILMEFADCGSLYDHIHKKGDYSDLDAVRWMEQLARGLEYLHAMKPRPIIHRDIKTKNLLLTDNYRVLKIADFGTVRELATLMTDVGTAQYMAPEVGNGGSYTEKSDVYSFGIVLWEVMSRKKPFYHLNNKHPLVIMNLVSKGERPPIEDATDIKDIRAIITNCWDSNPEKRPSMNNILTPTVFKIVCYVSVLSIILKKRSDK